MAGGHRDGASIENQLGNHHMSILRREPSARPPMTELFDRFDELAAAAEVGKVRFR